MHAPIFRLSFLKKLEKSLLASSVSLKNYATNTNLVLKDSINPHLSSSIVPMLV
jgi:hypothetical protein